MYFHVHFHAFIMFICIESLVAHAPLSVNQYFSTHIWHQCTSYRNFHQLACICISLFESDTMLAHVPSSQTNFMLANQNLGSMSRGFFVHQRSVFSLLTKYRQTKHSYHHVQSCAVLARISLCLLCATAQTNVNVSPATQGLSRPTSPSVLKQHNILYQQVQLSATDLSECECVPSDTRALTPNLTLCSMATQYIVPTGTTKYDTFK